jgi:hypothetical protein
LQCDFHDFSNKDINKFRFKVVEQFTVLKSSVAEPHHFYAALGKNLDAAPAPNPAPNPAPTLLYSRPTFENKQKLIIYG